MPNSLVKSTDIKFDESLEKFDNNLVISKEVDLYNTNPLAMEQANYTCYVPVPYISSVTNGEDATGVSGDSTQLSVPMQINFKKLVRKDLSALNMNDPSQVQKLTDSALQSLASQVNTDIMTAVANQGTQVVQILTPASGFDDISQADSIFNEQGVVNGERSLFLTSRDYNGMASTIATNTNFQKGAVQTAYERAMITPDLASFRTFKLDTGNRLSASTAGSVSINGANQRYAPESMSTAVTGETSPVDNRYMDINLTVGTGALVAGDCFTIAGVNSVHALTKKDTGELKTFRVIADNGSGSFRISPPIIDGTHGSATQAEKDYQNVSATPANGASVSILNTTTAGVNPFFIKDAVKLLPGQYAPPANSGALVNSGITENGIKVTMTQEYNSLTNQVQMVFRAFYGVTVANPEMAGIVLFNQI